MSLSLVDDDRPLIQYPREALACRLLDSKLTEADKDFMRRALHSKASKWVTFKNSERLLKLMRERPL